MGEVQREATECLRRPKVAPDPLQIAKGASQCSKPAF